MSAVSSNPLDAADPGRSAWVSANAGTGKTYTLANRVTRLLLEGNKPERILCLTYTKAAAAEMAGRLFAQLGEWAMLNDLELAERIARIGAPERDSQGLREARRLFALALETPGGLKIQTIHSFCQYLLARFPLEAGVPPSFRVLDDQTARDLRDLARARVLEHAGTDDPDLLDAVALLVTEADESKLRAIIDSALGSDRRKFERFLASLPENEDAIAAAVRRAHGVEADDSAGKFAAAFCAVMKSEEPRLRELIRWLAGGTTTDKMLAQSLLAAIESADFAAFADVFLTKEREPRKRLATKGLIADNHHLYLYLEDVAARLVATEHRCRAARAASLAEAALVLARAAHEEYAAAKRARGVLDYDDLIIETLRLLGSREAAGWVLYKLDGGLDHILVDEGQDTSPEQWQIIRRLAEEFFAGTGAREGKSAQRTIFVVGDEKQSIFSFQGADPAQFDVNRQYFAERAGAAANSFVTVQLSTSRRSAPEILKFIDEVFADSAAREGVTSQALPILHEPWRKTAIGRVEFWPTVKPIEGPKLDPWLKPVDLVPQESPAGRLAAQIADRIHGWTDGHTKLPGHENAIRPGDIMVLMPRREPFASELIRQLKLRGVPVAGADRVKLLNQMAIMDLIALGRFVLLPENDLNLAALLRSPLIGISEEELLELCALRKSTLWREVAEHRNELAIYARAGEFLSECLARADFAPPYEFYADVLGAKGMRKRLLERLGAEAYDAIDEFVSLALAYESLNPPSLEGFLHWLERGEIEIKRDMERGRNEVRVMTVHGAKGLEADIVILPDTTSVPTPQVQHGALLYAGDAVYFPLASARASAEVDAAKKRIDSEALKEHRRLFYVALTRARDQLHICGFEGKHRVKEGSWYQLAERAARTIGIAEPHGDEIVHVVGNTRMEQIPAVDVQSPRATLPGWLDKLRPQEHEPSRLIRPSKAAGIDQPATLSPVGLGAARFQRGILVHALLARLPEILPERRRNAAHLFLAKRGIDNETAASLVDETVAVLDDPAFAAAFAPSARAEVAIVADLPEFGEGARVSGRIDRLAVKGDKVLAIDFKTNRPPPARVEEVAQLYLTQMTLYRAALAKVFPEKRIACALVWTDGPTLMPLPGRLLDAESARIRTRLDPHGSRS